MEELLFLLYETSNYLYLFLERNAVLSKGLKLTHFYSEEIVMGVFEDFTYKITDCNSQRYRFTVLLSKKTILTESSFRSGIEHNRSDIDGHLNKVLVRPLSSD